MAATVINVPAIREGIAKAKQQIEEQTNALGDINNTINGMNGVWESADQRAYSEQFQTTKSKIENFNNSVNNSLDTMSKYVDDFVTVDENIASALRNISW